MSATRDPDRLLRAWLDLMPDEAPDRAIAAVLQATSTTPQVRALPRIGRWRFQMNRLSILAAVVALLALAGGAMLFGVGTRAPTVPAATPSPSPTITAASTPSPAPAGAFPATLLGDWVADAEPIPELTGQGPRIQLAFNWDGGRDLWVQTDYVQGYRALSSASLTADPGQIRLRSTRPADGCETGDIGLYQWTRSPDGLFLTLTLMEDDCEVRATTLGRTWVHTLSAVNDGGPGVLPVMNIQAELPARRFGLGGVDFAGDVTTFDSTPFIGLLLDRNPVGYADPCSESQQESIGPLTTVPEVVEYLDGMPGFETNTTQQTIDGRPASHVTLTPQGDGACPGDLVFLFFAPGSEWQWSAQTSDTLSFWLTDVDSDAWLFWYRGDAIPDGEEAAVISSIRFIDELPTP